MKKYFVLPLALFISLLSLFAFQSDKEWQTYSSTDGHFSIKFPGKPEESAQDGTTNTGYQFKVHIASYSPSDNEVYMAGWIDLHGFYPDEKTIKQILEDSRDGAIASMKATNVTTLSTVVSENPYIEFRFEADNIVGKDRIYIINKFQYSLITIFSKQLGLKPSADEFILSYKCLQ
jgi:hypothetical protein